MSFMIKSEVSEQYLLEEDAVEGFRQAVNNGQIRLALQILVDIVDVFEGFIAAMVEDEEGEEPETIEQKVEATKKVEETTQKVEESSEEEKQLEPAKKTAPKKAATKEEEIKNSAE